MNSINNIEKEKNEEKNNEIGKKKLSIIKKLKKSLHR